MFISDQNTFPLDCDFCEILVDQTSFFLKEYMILNGIADSVKMFICL